MENQELIKIELKVPEKYPVFILKVKLEPFEDGRRTYKEVEYLYSPPLKVEGTDLPQYTYEGHSIEVHYYVPGCTNKNHNNQDCLYLEKRFSSSWNNPTIFTIIGILDTEARRILFDRP